ncbi:MAG: amidohydrolase [Victivallales bacterium]|nr:amidohydrolase [Victivallales bacterium]
MRKETVREAVRAAIEARKDEIINVGRFIWKNPEPGYREVKTSAFLVDKLRSLGLTVKTGLALTGFRADIDTGKPGPTVAIIGELDSLIIPTHPECDKVTGAVHSCGHNASATSVFGAAIGVLAAVKTGEICGKIALIGAPAEEGIEMDYRLGLIEAGKISCISGKSELICEGVFNDVDAACMHHLARKFGYKDHNGCVNKRIAFHGKSCHAASPHNGINALNASSLAQHAIGLMREAYSNSSRIRIHGIITNGGNAVNVLPDTVTMEYMLRAPSLEEILALNERFDRIVMHAAHAAECTATIETIPGYMPLHNDDDLGAIENKMVHCLFPDAPFDANQSFDAGCTDMGDLALVVPSVEAAIPGAAGMGHGADYRVQDETMAYVVNSELNTLLAVELLYGDGVRGKEIASHKSHLMPVDEYIKTVKGLNRTVESAEVIGK